MNTVTATELAALHHSGHILFVEHTLDNYGTSYLPILHATIDPTDPDLVTIAYDIPDRITGSDIDGSLYTTVPANHPIRAFTAQPATADTAPGQQNGDRPHRTATLTTGDDTLPTTLPPIVVSRNAYAPADAVATILNGWFVTVALHGNTDIDTGLAAGYVSATLGDNDELILLDDKNNPAHTIPLDTIARIDVH